MRKNNTRVTATKMLLELNATTIQFQSVVAVSTLLIPLGLTPAAVVARRNINSGYCRKIPEPAAPKPVCFTQSRRRDLHADCVGPVLHAPWFGSMISHRNRTAVAGPVNESNFLIFRSNTLSRGNPAAEGLATFFWWGGVVLERRALCPSTLILEGRAVGQVFARPSSPALSIPTVVVGTAVGCRREVAGDLLRSLSALSRRVAVRARSWLIA